MPIIAVVMVGFAIVGNLQSLIPSLGRLMQQTVNKAWPNQIPDVYQLIRLGNQGYIDESEMIDLARKHGFNREWAITLWQAGRKLLEIYDYLNLWRRGMISEAQLDGYAERLEYPKGELVNIKHASQQFPSVGDLIRFAVREVFTPATAAKYGLFEDYPSEFDKEAAKAGLPEDARKWFWGAHWELPSIQMGFEMFHRDIITHPDLVMLLRSLDIMPYWRDKLIEMSYTTLTRVDVRRMYGLGILDQEGVYDNYRYGGYSPENAKAMTEFTVAYESGETTSITRASLISAYKSGIIDRDNLTGKLSAMFKSVDVVSYWVDMADYEKTEALIKMYADNLVDQYMAGGRDLDSVRIGLLEADVPSTYVDQVVQKIVLTSARKIKVPGREELEAWLRAGIVEEEYYVHAMRLHGYLDGDIERYLTAIVFEVDTLERKWLPLGNYKKWVKADIISPERLAAIMTAQGYSEEDITNTLIEIGYGENGSS